jgi:hypothetical protein
MVSAKITFTSETDKMPSFPPPDLMKAPLDLRKYAALFDKNNNNKNCR